MQIVKDKESEQQIRDWKLGRRTKFSRGHRGNVVQQLDPTQANEAFIARNRKHLLTMLDVVLFCVRQEIPLRGSDESKNSSNKGNFLETFDLLQKYSQDVKERFESLPQHAKMTHRDIQNDLLFGVMSLATEGLQKPEFSSGQSNSP